MKELRAQVEQLQRQQRVGKEPGVQGDSTRRESGLEEDCKMEDEKEIECKNKAGRAEEKFAETGNGTLRTPRAWNRGSGTGRKRSGRKS